MNTVVRTFLTYGCAHIFCGEIFHYFTCAHIFHTNPYLHQEVCRMSGEYGCAHIMVVTGLMYHIFHTMVAHKDQELCRMRGEYGCAHILVVTGLCRMRGEYGCAHILVVTGLWIICFPTINFTLFFDFFVPGNPSCECRLSWFQLLVMMPSHFLNLSSVLSCSLQLPPPIFHGVAE